MAWSFGDVLLVPFLYTDQSGAKRRPACVVASDAYNERRRDLVIVAITSRLAAAPDLGEAPVAEWQAAGLARPSVFKAVFMTIVEQGLAVRSLGMLSLADQRTLRGLLARSLG